MLEREREREREMGVEMFIARYFPDSIFRSLNANDDYVITHIIIYILFGDFAGLGFVFLFVMFAYGLKVLRSLFKAGNNIQTIVI